MSVADGRASLHAGQSFGPFVVLACAGHGGMGVVYRARDAGSRVVALKVMRPPVHGTSGDEVLRFLREARLAGALRHPRIVEIHEANVERDVPYLVMEWIDGRPLSDLVREGSLSLPQRLQILGEVAEALVFAHERGIVHRDVKPSNVMLDERGSAKLLDFGIAKRVMTLHAETQTVATKEHERFGTPAYMAPEQLLSSAVDGRADQFSWAVMAYEILGGVHPIAAMPTGSAFPLSRPRPLTWIRPDVPESLAAIVHRAMSYDPDGRFRSMRDVLAAWQSSSPSAVFAALGGHGQATSAGPIVISAPNPADTTRRPSPQVPAAAPRATHGPWPWAFGVLACLFAATVAVGLVVVRTRPESVSIGAPPVGLGGATHLERGLEELPFAGGEADRTAVKKELDRAVSSCSDGWLEGDRSLTVDVTLARDGTLRAITDTSACKDQTPGVHLCGDPPAATDACMRRAVKAVRFPRLTPAPGDDPAEDANATLRFKR